jgi:uncharacterized YccA/Bax inhibitor family protein
MRLSKSSNPTLSVETFKKAATTYAQERAEVMTVKGTVNKVLIMLLLIALGASYTWSMFFNAATMQAGASAVTPWIAVGAIGGLVLALITIFKMRWAHITAPIYAVLEGVFLGSISALFEAQFPGIVVQAVLLTFGTMFAMLFAYRTGLIKVTKKFRMGVVAATGGIMMAYFLTFILNLFGLNIGFMHSGGTIGIIISLVIIVIAALNLVLDFDFIDKGAQTGAPKFMEWYGAFGLMVTLIWLYIEILRLLAIIAASRD